MTGTGYRKALGRARRATVGAILAASLLVPAAVGAATTCRSAAARAPISNPAGGTIAVRLIGEGKPVLMIPSLGRGTADFEEVAGAMASQGWMTILPDPRGIGGTTGAPPKTLFDLVQDAAAVIGALCDGPVDVVGHAFGNRVARALATVHPDLVRHVALLAGGGEVSPPPEVVAALKGSFAQGSKPDALRLQDLQLAFFAKGNDPAVWLSGWYPEAARLQFAAATATPASSWWQAGRASLLLVQASEDPIAPMGNAEALRRDIGDRLTLVRLDHASHAILPEQPKAVTALLMAFFDGGRDVLSLQKLVDDNLRNSSNR